MEGSILESIGDQEVNVPNTDTVINPQPTTATRTSPEGGSNSSTSQVDVSVQGPPPAYSFLNQNQQELRNCIGSTPVEFNLKPQEEEQPPIQEPPPPYPFPQEEIHPSVQSGPQEEQNFSSLTELLGSSYDFSLKANALSCCPNFIVTPLASRAALSLPQTHNKIACSSSGNGCYSCCLPASSSWQTISFSKNATEEKLGFIYKPKAWVGSCGRERIVDIYIPERTERIGWIKFKEDFSDGALIFNALTNELFVSRKIEFDHSPLALTIVNSIGLPVAVASATSGVRYRGFTTWKTFRLAVSPVTVKSQDTRAILLVAFTMWIINYKEHTARSRFLYVFISILIGFGIGLALSFWGH